MEGTEQGQVGATCTQRVRHSQRVLGDVQHDGSEREERSVSDGPGVRVVDDILEDLTEVVMVTARLPITPAKESHTPVNEAERMQMTDRLNAILDRRKGGEGENYFLIQFFKVHKAIDS